MFIFRNCKIKMSKLNSKLFKKQMCVSILSAKIFMVPSKCEIIILSPNYIFFDIAIAILDFSLFCPFSYGSSLRQQKLSLLTSLLHFLYWFCRWLMPSFLYCSPYSFRSYNHRDRDSCLSFLILQALAKSTSNLFTIARI